MTSPRGMRCLCVALDVLTLSCCYQRVREEPDAGRDQLQRSHQRLQRDRRDCSHQRQNPRAASAPSNCAGCGPCPRARQGGTCTRAQDDPWRSDTWRSVAQRSDTSSASERSDSWRSGICNNSRRTSRQACFGQRHHTMAPVSSHQTAQQIKPNHPSDQTTAAVQSSWVLPPSPPLLSFLLSAPCSLLSPPSPSSLLIPVDGNTQVVGETTRAHGPDGFGNGSALPGKERGWPRRPRGAHACRPRAAARGARRR